MADEILKLPDDSANPGKKVDNSTLTVGANTVLRQRVQVAGDAAADVAAVANAAPTTQYGLVVRNIPSGTQAVSAASLPLPTGAATEATLLAIEFSSGSIDAATSAMQLQLPAILAAGGGMKIEGVAGGVAVPISVASLPLPSGAATQTTLAAVDTKLGGPLDVSASVVSVSVTGGLPLPTGAATEATVAAVDTKLGARLPAALGALGGLKIEGVATATPVPISAASLPLPAGAATNSTLAQVQGSLATMEVDLAFIRSIMPVVLGGTIGGLKVEGTVSLGNPLPGGANNIGDVDVLTLPTIGQLPTALAAGGGLKIEGVAAGVAVPVSAASLPLPTGAATETTLAAANTKLSGGLPAALAAGGGLKIEGVAAGVAVPVSISSQPLPTGAATETTLAAANTKLAGGLPAALAASGGLKIEGVAGGVVVPVSAASLPLPSGASTETTLAAMSSKLPAALVGGRLDVVLGAALPAGTAKVGEFIPAPVTVRKQITPTGSTSPAYTSGDVYGTGAVPQQIVGAARVSGGSGIIQSIIVHDKTALRPSLDLVFFDRSVTIAADNAAFAPSDADMLFCLGLVPIGPWNTAFVGAANSLSTLLNVGLPFVCNGSADLWFAIVVRGTPTAASTDQFSFTFLILQD